MNISGTNSAGAIKRQIEADKWAFQRRWEVVIKALQELDPEGWADWYDAQIVKTCGAMLPLIEERISELKSSHTVILQPEKETP